MKSYFFNILTILFLLVAAFLMSIELHGSATILAAIGMSFLTATLLIATFFLED